MQEYRVFVFLCAIFAVLLNKSSGGVIDQTECKDKNTQVLQKCCDVPDEELMTEEEKAAGAMCDKMLYGDRTPPATDEERMELFECMDECFYNATQLLTPEMKLNDTALLAEYGNEIENFPHWKEPIAKSLKTCVEKNVASEVKPGAKCKSGSFQFSNCLGINLYLNCPQESWKAGDEGCTKAREMLAKC